jgi:4-diphosphocytidyl-2-C-methyl-D-erythritol kinase|tara:strand:+ start:6317 stop:7171 length:855 start_codon:yes stop_codon:yes gene_type:complete
MPEQQINVLSPAKLNLFLHVLGRRPDGYHNLQTLFQLLDFGDEMTFSNNESGIIGLSIQNNIGAPLPMDSNLVVKAAKRLRTIANRPNLGAHITLTKNIPQGAGLGGGSSNAASTLTALNTLWDLNLSTAKLCEIGITLGADVPVFLNGKTAWGEGIGEKLEAIELKQRWYLVVTPPCQVSTKEIFCHQQLTRNSPAIKMSDFLAGRSHNDCEAITSELYPEVAKTLVLLRKFSESKMTGTGSSLFVEFKSEVEAMATLAKLPKSLQVFVAKGINSLDEKPFGD